MTRQELKKQLTDKLVSTYEVLEGYDFWAVDVIDLLSDGGEILLMSGRPEAETVQLIAIFSAGSASFSAVSTAVSFCVNCEARKASRAISREQAVLARRTLDAT